MKRQKAGMLLLAGAAMAVVIGTAALILAIVTDLFWPIYAAIVLSVLAALLFIGGLVLVVTGIAAERAPQGRADHI